MFGMYGDEVARSSTVDERVHHEHEGQRDPEAEQELDPARRPGGELRSVIFVAEIVPMLATGRSRVLVIVDGGHRADVAKPGSTRQAALISYRLIPVLAAGVAHQAGERGGCSLGGFFRPG